MFEEKCCDFICNHATLNDSTIDGSIRDVGDTSAFSYLLSMPFRFLLSFTCLFAPRWQTALSWKAFWNYLSVPAPEAGGIDISVASQQPSLYRESFSLCPELFFLIWSTFKRLWRILSWSGFLCVFQPSPLDSDSYIFMFNPCRMTWWEDIIMKSSLSLVLWYSMMVNRNPMPPK